MTSRTTDDYQQMALAGCLALADPAFWAGYDHASPAVFADYFERLTDFEPKRAARYGIQYYTWLCLNPKEAEDRSLAAQVLPMIPGYLDRPNVLGIGEIGLNRVTRNELATFSEQVDLAIRYRQMILVHTPHLEDKYKGTQLILDALSADGRGDSGRIKIDHVEEHTIGPVLSGGYWAGITLYPMTKTSHSRAVYMIEIYGPERICVSGACDWGPSDPIAIPKFALEMRRRGHAPEVIEKVIYHNPVQFLSQSSNFRVPGAWMGVGVA